MTDLHPTKTRLALLQAVADGAVTENYPLLPSATYSQRDLGPGACPRWRRCTAAIAAFERAGWVRRGNRLWDHFHAPRGWHLTDAGRAVLEAHSGR